MAHPGGRPLKFKTVDELQKEIDAYFESCWQTMEKTIGKGKNKAKISEKKQIKPYTITGLALALNTTRQTLLEYQGEVEGRERLPEFADAIKKAKQRCENYAEEHLFENNVAGVIFNLKNNYHWRDEKQVEMTGKDGRDLFPVNDQDVEDYAKWKLQQGLSVSTEPTGPDKAPTYLGDGQPD